MEFTTETELRGRYASHFQVAFLHAALGRLFFNAWSEPTAFSIVLPTFTRRVLTIKFAIIDRPTTA